MSLRLTNKIVDERLLKTNIRRIKDYKCNHISLEFLCLYCNAKFIYMDLNDG